MGTTWPDPASLPQSRDVRNEERLIVRVVVEPLSTSVGGQLVKQGEHFALIYKSDLPRVQAMLQTDKHRELLATATSMWNDIFAEHLKSFQGAREKPGTAKYEDAVEAAKATIGQSVESLFVTLPGGKKGRPPLLALEIGPTVAAPHTPAAAAEQQGGMIAQAIAQAIEMASRGKQQAAR